MIAKGKSKAIFSLAAFGLGVVDFPDAEITSEECEAISAAWARAALAIPAREYGKITAVEANGDEMMEIAFDYRSMKFDADAGLPLIAEYRATKIPPFLLPVTTPNFEIPTILRVSPAAFAELRVGMNIRYDRVFGEALVLRNVVVGEQREHKPTPHASARNRKKLRAGKPTMSQETTNAAK